MKNLQITREACGDVEVIRIKGALDLESVAQLESELGTVFERGRYRVMLDCGGLSFIGSAGVGALIGFARRVDEQQGGLHLFNIPERIFKVIDLLGFTKILKPFGTEQDALGSFASK